MIHAFRYEGERLVSCEHVGPRMQTIAGELGGNLVGLPGGSLVVVYLPLHECTGDVAERHREAVLAALGRCNACAQPLDEHNDEDTATCADVMREIAEDEAAPRAAP